jgi:hypothetical protein
MTSGMAEKIADENQQDKQRKELLASRLLLLSIDRDNYCTVSGLGKAIPVFSREINGG